MDFIGIGVLLVLVFYVKKSAECNNNDMFAMAGCDVSFNWTLGNKPIKAIRALLYHSSNKTADLAHGECKVMDNSSSFCNTSKHNDEWTLYLTIFNATEEKSGKYILHLYGEDLSKDVRSKELIVIGKPKLMEVRKPTLYQPFEMMCSGPVGLKCFVYKWKLNGSEITPVRSANTLYISSLRVTDNLSQITCQVCLNETASSFSSEICKTDGCTVDSDSYNIEVIYGPDNITLSLTERHFYLREYEPFTIYCFASCNPRCTFRWIGHDTINGEKLAITSFEPRMAGQYTCYATNQQTNITSIADPIILHHETGAKIEAKDIESLRLMQYWIGPVIVSALLLIVGVLMLVTHWRKNTTRVIDSGEFCQPCIGQTHSKMLQVDVGSSNRCLPHIAVQKHASRKTKILKYDNSISLQDLSDLAESFRSQGREELPLPHLLHELHNTKCQTRNSTISGDLRSNKSISDVREDNSAAKFQEDPYSDIDEDAMSVHDHRIDNLFENHSHQTGRTAEHLLYDYARSVELYHAETPAIHVTDETYITPISDLSRPSDIFQEECYITPISDLLHPTEHRENVETDALGKSQTYIAPINDFAYPFDISHVKENNNEGDTSYITPITG